MDKFPSPEDLNSNKVVIEDKTADIGNLLDRAQAENLSVKNVVARQDQLKRLFAWLIGIGLGLGVLVAIALVIAITKLGLAKKPYELEEAPVVEQLEEAEREDFVSPEQK